MNQRVGVKSRKPRSSTQEVVAYHEAGHAVAAWRLGIALRRAGITIVPDRAEGNLGSVSHVQFINRNFQWRDYDRDRIRAEKLAQLSLAGEIAQRRFSPRSVRRYHGESDRRSAIDLLSPFTDIKELEAWLKLLYIRTENMFSNPDVWNAVKRLAAALMQKRTICAKETIEIIREGFNERLYARYPQARQVWSAPKQERNESQMTTKKRTITPAEMKLLGGPRKFAALSQQDRALGHALIATKRKIADMKEEANRYLDALLQESTIGQLKHLASHPHAHYEGKVIPSDQNGPSDDDPMPLVTQKANVKDFTRGQVILLRLIGSKIVSAKARRLLKDLNNHSQKVTK